MNQIINYIILGIVQGFTEPLPISSSGHIEIAKSILNMPDIGLSFSILTNFASMLVIVIFFRERIIHLFVGFFGYIFKKEKRDEYKNDFMYALKVIIASVPLAIIGGLVVVTGLDEYLTDSLYLVASGLAITALMLYIVSKVSGADKQVEDLTWFDVLFIGFFQAIAIVPGISRSGLSLVGALGRKMEKSAAFEFVFILYIPASLGALLPSIGDIADDPQFNSLIVPYIAAFITTMIFTYLALIILRKILIADRLNYFTIYLLIVSSLIFISLIVSNLKV